MKTLILLVAVISTVQGWLYETGWTALELDPGFHKKVTEYLDFNPLDTRLQLRMTQLKPDENLQFGVQYQFFEEEKRTSFISSLNFDWDTKPGHKHGVFLFNSEDFSDCYEEKEEMLIVPTITSIDVDSDYMVELNNGQVRSSFRETCGEAWETWRRNQDRIRKLAIKVVDSERMGPGFNLQDYFTLEYRLVKACPCGTYLSEKISLCLDCEQDHYSVGGYQNHCNQCPYGSYVPAGIGFSESNCTFWYSCPGGYYLDVFGRCRMCSPGHYSPGGDVPYCTHCPDDSYSGPGARHCKQCPRGSGVEGGKGTSVYDCKEGVEGGSSATAICTAVPVLLLSAVCLL